MASYNVFLSSTFADFVEERKKLRELLPYIEVNSICAETAGDRDVGRYAAELRLNEEEQAYRDGFG